MDRHRQGSTEFTLTLQVHLHPVLILTTAIGSRTVAYQGKDATFDLHVFDVERAG